MHGLKTRLYQYIYMSIYFDFALRNGYNWLLNDEYDRIIYNSIKLKGYKFINYKKIFI